MVYCDGKLIENCYSYFIKPINNTFYAFTCVITQLGCWENTQTACKIYSPSARDLQAFLVFFQRPGWVITPVNP